MVAEILAELQRLLQVTFVKSKGGNGYLNSVVVMDAPLARNATISLQLPQVMIWRLGERREMGPESNTARQYYSFLLRCLCNPGNPLSGVVPAAAGGSATTPTFDIVAQAIQDLLDNNKILVDGVFEMRPEWELEYGGYSPADGKVYPAFDIRFSYTALRRYLGYQNPDDEPPPYPPDGIPTIEF